MQIKNIEDHGATQSEIFHFFIIRLQALRLLRDRSLLEGESYIV